MVLFVCMFKDYRYVDDLLLMFLEQGVTGATVLEARGMGQVLGSELPIFAALRGLFPGSASDTHVIVSAMTREKAAWCLEAANRIAGPFDRPGLGLVFTMPIEHIVGLKPEID